MNKFNPTHRFIVAQRLCFVNARIKERLLYVTACIKFHLPANYVILLKVCYTHPPREFLKNKEVIVIVGPSGVGKSAVARYLHKMDDDFGAPIGFTTRQPRPDDKPGAYRYLTHEQVTALRQDEIVQYIAHPDGNIYGTLVDDYGNPVSVVDAMTSSVDDFKKVGFGRVAVFGIIASPPHLLDRLDKRYPPITRRAMLVSPKH